jgi:hypothetical protein
MQYLECEIPEDKAYIIPIGDLHLGDKAFKKSILMGYLDWVKERPNARIFLNGDIFNVASRISKTDPFSTNTDEYQAAIDLFRPYASQIIGATDGNHEARMLDMFGVSPMQYLCLSLNIPYCKWSAVVRVKVGKPSLGKHGGWKQNYFLYFHHTTGGGGTIGGKLNRVTKLRDIVEGIDVYFGSHNHQLAVAPQDVYYPSIQSKEVLKRRIWYVDCGSYLEWNDSYAEKGMMAPTKLGSPRVRLEGKKKHDIHVSI